jgi:hypothetical protein
LRLKVVWKALLKADFKAVFICTIKSCLDTNLKAVLIGDFERCLSETALEAVLTAVAKTVLKLF